MQSAAMSTPSIPVFSTYPACTEPANGYVSSEMESSTGWSSSSIGHSWGETCSEVSELNSTQIMNKQRRERRRTAEGMTVVTTPWFPNGAIKETVTLATEVTALASLLQLTVKEKSARYGIRSALQESASRVWPEATVKVYGSFAYDCSLPDSALDLVCEDCIDLSNFSTVIETIASNAALRVLHTFECDIAGEKQAFAKFSGEGGVVANVTFVVGRSPARQVVAEIRRLLKQYPLARDVFAAIRMIFRQSGCANAADGGLPPYAILIMLLHTCQRTNNPNDAGQLLVDFFALFSEKVDYVVSARVQQGESKHDGAAIYVEDVVGGANVAAECSRVTQVNSVCRTCATTLAKWSTGQWAGYRGRSPLSSILAYDSLWDRAES
eukprot:Sspe_Gene.60136::Locus_33104_Transcript_1_1_Confidence_1.000_Length_1336::g.60136::m.60136/K03514/PAPD5_7, TRF4; non-canonical poly(A) RNA polymerase PAPD5/7